MLFVSCLLTCCLLKSKSSMSEEIGRRAILAVDREDILALIQLFDKTDHDINATTSSTGYLSYQWTPWIAQFLGDTLLHIALKKHKVLSSNTLLLLNANVNITNYFKETTDSICRSKFGYSIHQMKTNAANNILPHVRLSDSKKLACILPNIESLRRETLNFIDYGRLKNTVKGMASSEAIGENTKDIVEGIKRSSMQSNKKISTLTNLKYLKWDTTALQLLAEILFDDADITSVILTSIHLSSPRLLIIVPSLISMQKLEYLDFSQNCITDEDIIHLCNGLEKREVKTPLLRINLHGNRITHGGAQLLISALSGRASYVK